jgi:hypothetical protein
MCPGSAGCEAAVSCRPGVCLGRVQPAATESVSVVWSVSISRTHAVELALVRACLDTLTPNPSASAIRPTDASTAMIGSAGEDPRHPKGVAGSTEGVVIEYRRQGSGDRIDRGQSNNHALPLFRSGRGITPGDWAVKSRLLDSRIPRRTSCVGTGSGR